MNSVFLTCKESRIESPTNFYGCFYLGPLKSSQSLNVANSIRRVLLSEIKGLGITTVQIEGAFHEYSNLKGIKESVLDILLNIKDIVIKSDIHLKNQQIGFLKVQGPGIVRARDIKFPSPIQCVDPQQYIATLADDGYLNMKLIAHQGQTYMISNNSEGRVEGNIDRLINSSSGLISKGSSFKKNPMDRSEQHSNLNVIHSQYSKKDSLNDYPFLNIDTVFMPIIKANYVIEEQDWQNHLIRFEIVTNGSINPRQALFLAIGKLALLFDGLNQLKILSSASFRSLLKADSVRSKLLNNLEKNTLQFQLKTGETRKTFNGDDWRLNMLNYLIKTGWSKKDRNLNNLDIGYLKISLRTYLFLKKDSIETVGQLINIFQEKLPVLEKFDKKMIKEIELSLKEFNTKLV